MGKGDYVKFWQDKWCSVVPLKMLYSKLFSIAQNCEASMANLMSFRNGTLH